MPTYVSLWCWKQASPPPPPLCTGGGGDQKAQEELASRSPCSYSAVGGATGPVGLVNIATYDNFCILCFKS
jgi:hypothetical protein